MPIRQDLQDSTPFALLVPKLQFGNQTFGIIRGGLITRRLEIASTAFKFHDALSGEGAVEIGMCRRISQRDCRSNLGRGSIAGDEYLYDMESARIDGKGDAHWVETCFCDLPLAEERPYSEEYFQLLPVKDEHSRRNRRHENGTEPWECCDCACTKRLEEKLARTGKSF